MLWYNKFKYIFLSVLFVFASINFTKATLDLLKNKDRIKDLKEEVLSLEDKKEVLSASIAYKSTNEFVEESARNDLNLVKTGESVFVVNSEVYDTSVSRDSSKKPSIYSYKPLVIQSNLSLWVGFLLNKD